MSEDLERLRQDMSEQFSSIRTDLKEMSNALIELVRLEGKFDRVNELVLRIASEVDDLEKRVRVTEQNSGVHATRISNNERIAWMFVSGAVGLVVYFVKTGGM